LIVIEQGAAPRGREGLAVFSPDRRYRYRLDRAWDRGLPAATFIGLTPSTAGATADDQTIRQVCRFAEREGCGQVVMLNLFALVTTPPGGLGAAADPVGAYTDTILAASLGQAALAGGLVVAAWGNTSSTGTGPLAAARVRRVRGLLGGRVVHCLGVTAAGQPRHPCRLAHDAPLLPYQLGGHGARSA